MPDSLRELDPAELQTLLDVAPDAFVIVNGAGTIVQVNRATEGLFGYAPGELIGQVVEVLLPDRLRTQHQGHREAFHAQPRHRAMGEGMELSGVRKDGTEFPVDISLGPIATSAGQVVVAAVRDATQRKRHEEIAFQLTRQRLQRRQALELNDRVVQGLVAAQLVLERGDRSKAQDLVQATLGAARVLIDELLSDLGDGSGLQPGDLVRSEPATLERD